MPLFSKKEQSPKKIAATVHVQKLVHNISRKQHAQRAIKEIVKVGQCIMGTKTVKIDQDLNTKIWAHGRASTPVRVRVVFERKADDANVERMITVASYQDVASFKGLKTEKVLDQ